MRFISHNAMIICENGIQIFQNEYQFHGGFMSEKAYVKKDFLDAVRLRIMDEIKKKGLLQKELLELCQKHGYSISQSRLSKLQNGKTVITLYELSAFCAVLGISLNDCVWGSTLESTQELSKTVYAVNPKYDEAFKGYLGLFHVFFFSTDPYEEKLLFGKMNFYEQHGKCMVEFILDTGVKGEEGDTVKKSYMGQMFISKSLGMAYSILVNNIIGDVAFIEFKHRNFYVREVRSRIGMVLTTSAGNNKMPVMHRILLVRDQDIVGSKFSRLCRYLQINEEGQAEKKHRQYNLRLNSNEDDEIYNILAEEGDEDIK